MPRFFYKSTLSSFAAQDSIAILGQMANLNSFDLSPQQRDAWIRQVEILKTALSEYEGTLYFEYSIPRMGRRIDAVILIGPAIFVIEFKVGENHFKTQDLDQVMDYGLDLTHFHEGSHEKCIIPILVATEAADSLCSLKIEAGRDRLLEPLKTNAAGLEQAIETGLTAAQGVGVNSEEWEQSRYKPTPTIIEATLALYRGHSVVEITKNDAGDNLTKTSAPVSQLDG